ncbi:MAG: MMPL family transporter [Eubacterium sp.]|nr:MMPL family transporter [Eubacterium sp.]
MIAIGKWIAKLRYLILLVGLLLLIPATIGMISTRVNYDLLSYLPERLETVKGQNIMVDEFGTGGFSMAIMEGMELKDVKKLEDKISQVPHVKDVLWYDDVADLSMPVEMIPERIRKSFFTDDATMMLILLDDTTSSDSSMDAIVEIRKLVGRECFLSGMTGVVNDIKDIALKELPVYVIIAGTLSLIILLLATDSFIVPIFFLISIGVSILYNLGTNFFLGQISYITKALTAVLQLAVTIDYSIFLLSSYEENKQLYPEDRNEAMGHAIAATFRSIVGSSVTTVAGFIALCFMTFTLGRDLGIVMAKGVLLGVVTCVTFLPSMILIFDKAIEKTKHRPLIRTMEGPSRFIIRHYKIWIVIFLLLLGPALYGNSHYKIYYDIARGLPDTMTSNIANEKLKSTFNMSTMHVIMLDRNLPAKDKRNMMKEIEKVDGVKHTISIASMMGPAVPDSMIPDNLQSMLRSDKYELAFVSSKYSNATPKVNAQLSQIDQIVKSYDKTGLVIGEAPLMKDLQDVTDIDLKMVNIVSMAAIFVIIMLVFKSISLPVLLVAVIEFAIAVNMSFACYKGTELAFVASIVIGTIQLGATVDYAILMTSRYIRERQEGKDKKEAVMIAHETSMLSIITSGISFFAATFGVAAYTSADMIGSICTLLARGAMISMVVVLFILPAFFMVFDRVICASTLGFRRKKEM